MKYVYQMATFCKFQDPKKGFFIDYEFDQFTSSRKNGLQMCQEHVDYLVRSREVLSASSFDYKTKCGRYQIISKVVDNGKVEYYGIIRRVVF